ncbi:MAG: serine hydrolase [candidate division WOR-3 bacterium]|nr:MAG: serine hydrolase [candidate division WOR-3 bacterium]
MSFSSLDRFLKQRVNTGDLAGAVCWVGTIREELFFKAYGSRQVIPSPVPMHKTTLFDTASLTKPLVTALAIMELIEERRLDLQDTLSQYLDEFRSTPSAGITIMQLLTHTSGLPAWFPLYTVPQEKRLSFLATCSTGEKEVVYSCLGYILLGILVEKITGYSLEAYCREHLYGPLGLKDTLFNPAGRDNVAATEFGNEYERNMASQVADVSGIAWRNYLIQGEVHDGNAFYGFRGIAGNAGLFSTAHDLTVLMRAFLAGDIVRPKTVQFMTTDHTGGEDKRGAGWVMDPFPDIVSHRAFYHTGFTGTMLLCDPIQSLVIIFLTNAVHPYVRKDFLAPIRKQVVQFITTEYTTD